MTLRHRRVTVTEEGGLYWVACEEGRAPITYASATDAHNAIRNRDQQLLVHRINSFTVIDWRPTTRIGRCAVRVLQKAGER